jgi:hypothetical protein
VFETIYSQVGLAAAVLVVTFAFIKGDEPERMGAAAYALTFLATTMINDGNTSLPRWGVMGIETVLLGVFLGIAVQSRRAWPVWVAGFQALVVTSHILVAVNLRPAPIAMAAVNNLANYGLLIAMAAGTFWAWQDRRAATMSSDRAKPPTP